MNAAIPMIISLIFGLISLKLNYDVWIGIMLEQTVFNYSSYKSNGLSFYEILTYILYLLPTIIIFYLAYTYYKRYKLGVKVPILRFLLIGVLEMFLAVLIPYGLVIILWVGLSGGFS